jgi:hypothetical protein
VLAVTGTGVSMAITANNPLASWTGLISNGIDRCIDLRLRDAKWGDQQKKLLEGDLHDLLGVAEHVSRRLGWKPTEPCGDLKSLVCAHRAAALKRSAKPPLKLATLSAGRSSNGLTSGHEKSVIPP